MPAPLLGMYLFLASEAMFFLGLLGAFVVLESTGQEHQLFVRSSQMLSGGIGIAGTLVLLLASAVLAGKKPRIAWIAIAAGIAFLLLQAIQWKSLLQHHTCVARLNGSVYVFDGNEPFTGPLTLHAAKRINLPQPFDIHQITAADFAAVPHLGRDVYIDDRAVLQDLSFGPSRNNFFASYFLMTAVHGIHLIVGILAMGFFALHRKLPASVQMYWHFVNAIGVLAWAVLYFV